MRFLVAEEERLNNERAEKEALNKKVS